MLPTRGDLWAGDAEQMGPRGSADPTHDGRDGLPPVRDLPQRRRESRLQAPGPHALSGRVDATSDRAHRPKLGDPARGTRGSQPRRSRRVCCGEWLDAGV